MGITNLPAQGGQGGFPEAVAMPWAPNMYCDREVC